jgi:UDP-N-acetylmuramoylalanine--D-glutamate ligase
MIFLCSGEIKLDLKNKKVLVCGLARSGIAAIKFLKKKCAIITACDSKEKIDLKELRSLSYKINICLGKNPDRNLILKQDLIIISPGISCKLNFIKLARANNIPVWSEIELAYRFAPCDIIGITGTNGKTTTTKLTGEIIKKYFCESMIAGNIGIPIIKIVDEMLETQKNNNKKFIIAEISSFQLETINLFKPKISVVLNITPDHLDRYKTFENYIDAKKNIFANQTKDDYLILNYDDEICRSFEKFSSSKIIFFSVKNKLQNGIFVEDNIIKICFDKIKTDLININKINLIGEHNIYNILASICVAACVGVPSDIICDTVKNFKAVEHRLEFVREIDKIKFYNDSKGTNVDSSVKALQAIKSPTILIAGGYDKKVDFYDLINNFTRVKELILIGEVKNKIASQCDELGFKNYSFADSFIDAVKKSYELASSGDCVLLSPACASFDMFDNFEQRGNLFKQVVNGLSAKTKNI